MKISLGTFPHFLTPSAEEPIDVWTVGVVNAGCRPVEIIAVGLVHPLGRRSSPPSLTLGTEQPRVTLPLRLGDGERVLFYLPNLDPLGRSPVQGAYAVDALGQTHIGRYRPRPRLLRWKAWRSRRKFARLVKKGLVDL